MSDCKFCNIPQEEVMHTNFQAICFLDRYPVTKYHSLIVPRKHLDSFWEISEAEWLDMGALITPQCLWILKEDPTVEGFNMGFNIGEVAGQTSDHIHLHIIPRRPGDVENPRGGIRGIIPGKADY